MTINEKHKGNIRLIYGSIAPLVRQKGLTEIRVYSGYNFPDTYQYGGITYHHTNNGSQEITFSDNIHSIAFERIIRKPMDT